MSAQKKLHRQIISRIPHRDMTGEQWGLVIQSELIKTWFDAMSLEERQTSAIAFEHPHLLTLLPSPLLSKLDSIILDQTETLGWRITLCELVRFRMSEWDLASNGPELFERLGSAMGKASLILQRKKLPPLDADAWLVKRETIQELKPIVNTLRAHFSRKKIAPKPTEAREFFATTVSDSSFVHVRANIDRWLKFFEENQDALDRLFLDRRPTPASLYDRFNAWSSGWEQESLRQAISDLGTSRL